MPRSNGCCNYVPAYTTAKHTDGAVELSLRTSADCHLGICGSIFGIILDQAQIDHPLIDLIVGDERRRKPIRRPQPSVGTRMLDIQPYALRREARHDVLQRGATGQGVERFGDENDRAGPKREELGFRRRGVTRANDG